MLAALPQGSAQECQQYQLAEWTQLCTLYIGYTFPIFTGTFTPQTSQLLTFRRFIYNLIYVFFVQTLHSSLVVIQSHG